MSPDGGGADQQQLTRYQRYLLRGVVKEANKRGGEALSSEDWEAYFRFAAQPRSRAGRRILRALPSTPRCGYCGAPFAGVGGAVVRRLGYTPSRKNPNVCATCVELAPPGGTTMEIGVLFADLRGFTALSTSMAPAEVNALLHRFYAVAEKALLPEALIDKLIGDEVMALFAPVFLFPEVVHDPTAFDRGRFARLMLDKARLLLEGAGYGRAGGPAFELGIGLDFGEAFVGNVGDAAVRDFTAVGDVVNTASRLQGQAAGGEIVLSARLAAALPDPPGTAEELQLKGKDGPFPARRVRPFAR